MNLRTQQAEDQAKYEQRQRALDLMQDVCAREKIRETSVCSAAAYLFAMAARVIGWQRDKFLSFAGAVWDDHAKQQEQQDAKKVLGN